MADLEGREPTDVIGYSARSHKWVPITVVPAADGERATFTFTGEEHDGRPVVELGTEGTHRVLEFHELVAGGYRKAVPPPNDDGDMPDDFEGV